MNLNGGKLFLKQAFDENTELLYSGPPLPAVSVTLGQPWSKGIKRKIPEINHSCFKLGTILSSMMKSLTFQCVLPLVT